MRSSARSTRKSATASTSIPRNGTSAGATRKATAPLKAPRKATAPLKAPRKATAPLKAPRKATAPLKAPRKAAAAQVAAAARARATYAKLREMHPDAHCELDHRSPFQLLVATVLSAQTTDVLVNKVTPHLFGRYPDAASLAAGDPAEIGALLLRLGMGMYNQKARNIVGLARDLVTKHGGEVPRTLGELVTLPGVGRKTANVVLGVAFGAPEGVVVDTHVQRLSQRLGWTESAKPELIERDLCALFPRADWDMLSHTLVFHGRRICFARKPACAACGVNDTCPSAFQAEEIGRKPRRPRPRKTTLR